MAKQAEIFLDGEGDAWHERNKDTPRVDPVMPLLERHGIAPEMVLEIGCGTGWRLHALRDKYQCACFGIDPSATAIATGRKSYPMVNLARGIGTKLSTDHFVAGAFDLIIFGFCLYLVDRDDLFFTVAEADRVLKTGGYIAIQDFYEQTSSAVVVPYKHHKGVFCYKMHYEWLWLGSPSYQFIEEQKYTPGEAVTLIKKAGWPISATPPR